MQATDINAGTGGINLDAGGDLKLLAAMNSHSSTHTDKLTTDGMLFSIDGGADLSSDRRRNNKAEQQNQTAQVTQLSSAGDITTHSGGDTRIEASVLSAQGTIDLTATGYAASTNADGTRTPGVMAPSPSLPSKTAPTPTSPTATTPLHGKAKAVMVKSKKPSNSPTSNPVPFDKLRASGVV